MPVLSEAIITELLGSTEANSLMLLCGAGLSIPSPTPTGTEKLLTSGMPCCEKKVRAAGCLKVVAGLRIAYRADPLKIVVVHVRRLLKIVI